MKSRVTCIDFQIRIRSGHGPVTCTRNLTFSPSHDGLTFDDVAVRAAGPAVWAGRMTTTQR